MGRTMFETDRLPHGWAQRINQMDEVSERGAASLPASQVDQATNQPVVFLWVGGQVWVPSSFQRDVFLAAGVSASKLFLLPEAVDTAFFSPHSPLPPYRLLPLSEEGQPPPFVFLSVFKVPPPTTPSWPA